MGVKLVMASIIEANAQSGQHGESWEEWQQNRTELIVTPIKRNKNPRTIQTPRNQG